MNSDLVNIARKQIFEEYIAKRQNQYDQWIIKADAAWKEERTTLPYPPCSVYPDEEEIYNRVNLLSKKLTDTQDTQSEVSDEKSVKEIVETKLPILLQQRKDTL